MTYQHGIETPRLVSRDITEADIPAWIEYCADPVATRFTAMPGKTPEEMARTVIGLTMQRHAGGRYGLQALISKDTGELIGKCGILRQDVELNSEFEIGYHLLRNHWGKGYATEAATAFRDYGFENRIADSFVSFIHPHNEASKQVALRNGMTQEGNILFRDVEHSVFRIRRVHWEKLMK